MTTASPRVGLVYGFWGQNIGNAFFNVGGEWILEEVFGQGRVALIQDQPGYRTFHPQHEGNPERAYPLLATLDLDYLVLQGPLLTGTVSALWDDTLEVLRRRGTRLLLVGAAFFKFTPAEIDAGIAFIRRHDPALVSTRDATTYGLLQRAGLGVPLHDGIDSAFFVPRSYQPPATHPDSRPFVALNFDRVPEPVFTVGSDVGTGDDTAFGALGLRWRYEIPGLPARLAARDKVMAYVGGLLNRHPGLREVAGHDVVRPCHRYTPHVKAAIYQRPNAIVSDEPFTYFATYANAALTLSDRVHACAASMAYGTPAMLFSPTPRAGLLDRVADGDPRRAPTLADPDRLHELQEDELAFLRAAL